MKLLKPVVALIVVCFALAVIPNATAQELPPVPFPDQPEPIYPPEPVSEEYNEVWIMLWNTWFPVVGQIDNPTDDDGFRECTMVTALNVCVALWYADQESSCNLWVSAGMGGCLIE